MKSVLVACFTGALFLGACGNTDDSVDKDRIAELQAALEAEQAQSAELEGHIKNIQAELADAEDDDPPVPAPACPSNLHTFAKNIKGNSCATYTAWIKGWSEKCMANCNAAARLAEATADADATCAKFCSDRGCAGHTYSPPAACAAGAGGCANSKICPAACKKNDRCYLEQGNVRVNCTCSTTAPPKEPIVEP